MIAGNGPSLNSTPLELLRDEHVIGSYRPFFDRAASDDATVYLQSLPDPAFASDPRRGVWEGATVTYVAMQIAYWLGFEEVVLVGVDHRFSAQGPAHQAVVADGPDLNHFDPNYFGPGVVWQLPDLVTSEIAYRLAHSAYEADGRQIIDCTVDGALTAFPRDELVAVLSRSPSRPSSS